MIKAEAFLAIEGSLTDRLASRLGLLTKRFVAEVDKALSIGDFDEAERLINSLDLSSMMEGQAQYMEYMTNVAMVFGASRVTPRAKTSSVGLGSQKEVVTPMVANLNTAVTRKLEDHLREQALQLVARKRNAPEVVQKEERRVLRPFAEFVDAKGKAYLNLVSSLHTSRVSAYGFTAEAAVLDLEEYQLNEQLDNRTCPVCRMMHGKRFKVKEARDLLEVVTRTDDPDALKELQPWPSQSAKHLEAMSQMTAEELVSKGWHIPPFHPRCRGLLARVGRVGRVPALPAQGEPPVPVAPYVATENDFEALGHPATPKQIQTWNDKIGLPPIEIAASVLGMSFADALLASQSKEFLSKLWAFKVRPTHLAIATEAQMYGSKKAIEQQLTMYFNKKSTLYIGDLTIDAADQGSGILKKHLLRLALLAQDMSLNTMSVTAAKDMGGYVWSKLGFAPTAAVWSQLKKQISANYRKIKPTISIEAQQAVESILESADPKDAFLLADLGLDQTGVHLGKALLAGTVWDGELNFGDVESMARFHDYLG